MTKYFCYERYIYVEGRLKNRQWQGEDGQTRYTTEVHVQDFTFLTTKKESVSNAQNTQANSNTQKTNTATAGNNDLASYDNDAEQDDDLPF